MLIEKLPKKEILEFSSPQQFGVDKLARYYRNSKHRVCEYSIGIKLMWETAYRYAFAEAGNCLICRDEYDGITYFDYPIEGETADIDVALSAIESYCMEQDIPLRFTTLPPSCLGFLTARYDGVQLRKTYLWRDYIYRTEDICSFEGKKYAGQRNHIRRFRKNYPQAVFRAVNRDDLPAIRRFADRFDLIFSNRSADAIAEREAAFAILQMDWFSIFRIGCMELDGEIIGIALAEKCGDTLVEHIEKALSTEYEGIYPTMFQEFVRLFGSDCKYVNREDDAAERGLRMSKYQYQPVFLSDKFDLDVQNLLYTIDSIPTLKTERLTLNAIEESDALPYGKLCLDDAHNRYWGYDYRADLHGEAPDGEWFVCVAKTDFEEKRCINFAVRLDSLLIGEVILHHFDSRGGAEIGIRIDRAFVGRGFAKEALAAASDWALYQLGITRLFAQCFQQNTASERLLSSLMRKTGEEGTMISFERKI